MLAVYGIGALIQFGTTIHMTEKRKDNARKQRRDAERVAEQQREIERRKLEYDKRIGEEKHQMDMNKLAIDTEFQEFSARENKKKTNLDMRYARKSEKLDKRLFAEQQETFDEEERMLKLQKLGKSNLLGLNG